MLKAIEKAREALSNDSQAYITIDVFWQGEDYERELNIEEFN